MIEMIAVIILAIGIVVVALIAISLAVRSGAVKEQLAEARGNIGALSNQLKVTSDEFIQYKKNAIAARKALNNEIEAIEQELESCDFGGGSGARKRLLALLQDSEAKDDQG